MLCFCSEVALLHRILVIRDRPIYGVGLADIIGPYLGFVNISLLAKIASLIGLSRY